MTAPSENETIEILQDFIRATAKARLSSVICSSCARETALDNVQQMNLTNIPHSHLLAPDTPNKAHVLFNGMLLCKQGFVQNSQDVYVCDECLTQLRKETRPPLSLANNMWVGDVPLELQNLHLPERLMIAKGFPSAYIVKLYPKKKGAAKWGTESQFYNGLRGNVTTYKMDPAQMAGMICNGTFPHSARILSATIGVSFVGPKGMTLHGLPGIFRVRRWKIREALRWLKANNPLYADITISEERLNELPEDGIPEEILLTVKYSSDTNSLNREGEGYVPEEDENEEGTCHIFVSSVQVKQRSSRYQFRNRRLILSTHRYISDQSRCSRYFVHRTNR